MEQADRKRLGIDKLKHGEFKPWRKKDYPKHDPKRRHFKLRCIVCNYKPHHRLYVCPKCGNCQWCGGANQVGVVHQACMWCGNGANINHPDLPVYSGNHAADPPNEMTGESFEVKTHKKKQSSASVSVTNIQA